MKRYREIQTGDYIARVSEQGVLTNIGGTYRIELREDRVVGHDESTCILKENITNLNN